MPRHFNIAGACIPALHYMLPPEGRLPDLDGLIAQGAYFVVHAPRQTGKTTAMQALAKRLREEGRYAAVYFSCERARAFPDDVATAERAVWTALEGAADNALPEPLRPPPVDAPTGSLLYTGLGAWAERCPKPLVLVFDEIDSLEGSSLKSVLSQLRDGYNGRGTTSFAHSVILCGVRDVRDYKAASGGSTARLGSSSPFNIKMKSIRLGNFNEAELRALYNQHTEETGQVFTEDALARAWELSRGQPWLCNALAREVVEEIQVPLDQPITAAHIDEAKERLILARATHLDSLLATLRDDRIRRVLEPIIAGQVPTNPTLDDDLSFAMDLGLVDRGPPPQIANPIYREVILRVLASPAEGVLPIQRAAYITRDGRLDMDKLLSDFAEFWVQHGGILARGIGYQEAAPHLVLMAWLHRIVNGGGFIEREVGIGTERIDLLLRWPYTGPDGARCWQTEAVEIKAWRDQDRKYPLAQGLKQIDAYLDKVGLSTGILALFDDRSAAPDIEERTSVETATTPSGRTIRLLRG